MSGVDNGLAKRASHSAVASQAVIHALVGASGWAWRVSGDDGVEPGVEGLVVFDRERAGSVLKGVKARSRSLKRTRKVPSSMCRSVTLAPRNASRPGRLDGVAGCAGAEGERLGERAFFAARQGLREIGPGAGPRPMRVLGLAAGESHMSRGLLR